MVNMHDYRAELKCYFWTILLPIFVIFKPSLLTPVSQALGSANLPERLALGNSSPAGHRDSFAWGTTNLNFLSNRLNTWKPKKGVLLRCSIDLFVELGGAFFASWLPVSAPRAVTMPQPCRNHATTVPQPYRNRDFSHSCGICLTGYGGCDPILLFKPLSSFIWKGFHLLYQSTSTVSFNSEPTICARTKTRSKTAW